MSSRFFVPIFTLKMSNQVHIRCSKCGVFNVNNDHCESCGNLLSVVKQREIVRAKRDEQLQKEALEKEPSKVERYIQKMRQHRLWIVRAFFEVIYTTWVIAMAIGAFIAWLIAMIVA